MGSLLGVAIGSAEPPVLIVLRYRPDRGTGERPSGTRRQGRHFRYRRYFHQTRRRHGEDEVRYGRRRCHDRRHAGHRPIEAGDPGERIRPLRGEHAGQPRPAARRHRDRHERQDHRGDQYRCRGPADSGRRPHLCAPPGLHPPGGCRDPDRRHRGRPRAPERRPLRQRGWHARSRVRGGQAEGERMWLCRSKTITRST